MSTRLNDLYNTLDIMPCQNKWHVKLRDYIRINTTLGLAQHISNPHWPNDKSHTCVVSTKQR